MRVVDLVKGSQVHWFAEEAMYPKFIRFVAAPVKSAMANDHVHRTADMTTYLPQLVFLNQLKPTGSTSVRDCIQRPDTRRERRPGDGAPSTSPVGAGSVREVAADHLVGRRGKARDFASLASPASLIVPKHCQ
jgi:hypothetical protein